MKLRGHSNNYVNTGQEGVGLWSVEIPSMVTSTKSKYSEAPNKRVTFLPASPGQASWGKCNTLIRNFRVHKVAEKRAF